MKHGPWNTRRDKSLNQITLGHWLTDWGDWVDRAAVYTGYPTESSTASATEAIHTHDSLRWALPGGGSYRYALPSRHAILCFEMPRRLARLHQAIICLPPGPKGALTFWYAYGTHLVKEQANPKAEGKPMIWHRADKAAFVGMTYDALERRVSRARYKLAKILTKNVASVSEKVLQIATVE